ncbi:hypothetical protein [Leptospira santarosai]|uniref:hypothetical protein n=1 Tax=Leptospira santarosai TaxID=28183 RepID=UPI00117AE3B9|nr:hypothetical protein [Leptospira santarosai]MDI7173201.1 hypothetical protein [Leptospira santarosai]MDI7192821.1 hypothetical protein [Leptospira santarosai]MDO6397252.1 hypothetical protein [Leptospira santarosai]MDO6402661.1 hypothetical protein [Leptospira santarosai]
MSDRRSEIAKSRGAKALVLCKAKMSDRRSEIAKSREAKALVLCKAKMSDRRSEIAKSRGAETHCFSLWVETKCWFFAKQR